MESREGKIESQNPADELRQLILGIKNSFGDCVGNKEELERFLLAEGFLPVASTKPLFISGPYYKRGESAIHLSETSHFDLKVDGFVPDERKFVVLDFKGENYLACLPLDNVGRYKNF